MTNILKKTLLLLGLVFCASASDEDFAFETTDEHDEQLRNSSTDWNAPFQYLEAPVGRVFHLVVPMSNLGSNPSTFQARLKNGKALPRWLLFDKTDAIFWGVPLKEDSGNLHIIVKNLCSSCKDLVRNIIVDVQTTSAPPTSVKKCSSSEKVTFLSLVIDKGAEEIKPKQRVVAINDISKFFGIPYSAFTLKTSNEKIDPSDDSIILAGPGNSSPRTSNATSILEVPVGCDGTLFTRATSFVHQLKSQAKDGTISEVLRLPLTSWQVRMAEGRVVAGRERRQALELGSGEYDGDYYDDYEEDYDEEEAEIPITPKKELTKPITTTTQKIVTTVPENSSTHPHRHHHGEPKKDEIIPEWPIVEDNSLSNDNSPTPVASPEVPKQPTTTLRSTTAATQPSTTTTIMTTTIVRTTPSSTTVKMEFPVVPDTNIEDDYGDYETDDYEEEDDEDPSDIESETLVPIPQVPRKAEPEITSTTTTTPTPSTTTTTSTSTSTTTEAIVIKETTLPEETTTTFKEIPITTVTSDGSKTETLFALPQTTYVPIVVTESETIPTTMAISTTTSTIPTPTTTSPSTTSTTTIPTTTTTTTTTTTPISITSTATTNSTTQPATTDKTIKEVELTTPTKLTTLRHVSSTQSTTIPDEGFPAKNDPPYIENRLNRKYVFAGKVFRFVIPDNTFRDSEDNYDLKLEFLDKQGKPIAKNSWCQFNPLRKEIYGLPLDDHVFKWEYVIRATDKDGGFVEDGLTILVQQHKLQRVFNHEFSMDIRVEKKDDFKHYIDWSLKALRALGRIYNTNMSEITVRKVVFNTQPVVFSWSNDSLATSYCPKPEIEKLFKVLTANDRGDPSRELNAALSPELRAKKVSYQGMGVCEEINTPIAPPVNYPPFLRNPVNHINATVGELLIFRVPKDTFYDPEDLDTFSLNLTLLTADRQEIPSYNWLQFDSKNREFFGIPKKTSRSEYQLVCVDSGGLLVIDSLEVVVYPAPRLPYNVEFSMTIETLYDKFINSASLQKKFVEKLVEIFGDKNASHIHFLPFKQKQHSTVATWYNKSLSVDKCDHERIDRLEAVMKNEELGISNRVHAIMEPDFQVSTIKMLLTSNCKVPKPKYHVPKVEEKIPVDESAQTTSSSDDYLLTFIIPVIVIAIMTFFALLAACILYRRRRTGKMNVLEEGRQSYGNKGIPVIFQEELDEKPEAGTKAPAILKDEKPPLAPPEYSKSGSLKFRDDSEPYHPPPPFARGPDNSKQSRPKPAPTYRKPPPYVPP